MLETVDITAAAEYLGVNPETVRLLVKAGKIPAYKPGRAYRFKPHELIEYFESCKVQPCPSDSHPSPRTITPDSRSAVVALNDRLARRRSARRKPLKTGFASKCSKKSGKAGTPGTPPRSAG